MDRALIEILTPLCPEIHEQGTLAPDAPYPDRFFTFWNPASDANKHYDNEAFGYVWEFDVNFYSTDPDDVYDTIDAARRLLLRNGWRVGGLGHSVASDHHTHTGRGFTASYLQIRKEITT